MAYLRGERGRSKCPKIRLKYFHSLKNAKERTQGSIVAVQCWSPFPNKPGDLRNVLWRIEVMTYYIHIYTNTYTKYIINTNH